MKIAVAKEIDPAEPRVAVSPDTVKKFKALGVDIAVEPGAGIKSGLPDSEFIAAGAVVSADALKDADIVIKVKRPEASELANYKRGALVIAIMDPYGNAAALKVMQQLQPKDLDSPNRAGYYGLILKATGSGAKAVPYLEVSSKGPLLPEERQLFARAKAGT